MKEWLLWYRLPKTNLSRINLLIICQVLCNISNYFFSKSHLGFYKLIVIKINIGIDIPISVEHILENIFFFFDFIIIIFNENSFIIIILFSILRKVNDFLEVNKLIIQKVI